MAENTWAKRPSIATLICPRSPRGQGNKQSSPAVSRDATRRGRRAGRLRVVRPGGSAVASLLKQIETRGWARAFAPANGCEGEGRSMLTRRGFAGLFATTMLTSGGLARSAAAQAPSPQAPSPPAWPTRHVRLIVPFVPGGAADAIARVVGNRLSEAWGQQVVVENRGGAGANIGAQVAAGSDPDGYTLYITSVPHATNRFLYPSLNYDPIADFAPVTLICTHSHICPFQPGQ